MVTRAGKIPSPKLKKKKKNLVNKNSVQLGAGGSPCNLSLLGEAEIGRIMVRGQPGQIVCETPSPK
jgi:hypothetical protein